MRKRPVLSYIRMVSFLYSLLLKTLAIWGSIRMPCIWGQHNGSQLFLPLAILPPSVSGIAGGQPAPQSSIISNALIDTGATTTGISSRLAAQLQLQPVGKIPIHGVGGVQHHNSYLFLVGFPFVLPPGTPPLPGLPLSAPGQAQGQIHIVGKVIHGCEFHGATNFDVILGMDVISIGSLVVQGNHTFSFSF